MDRQPGTGTGRKHNKEIKKRFLELLRNYENFFHCLGGKIQEKPFLKNSRETVFMAKSKVKMIFRIKAS